MASALKKELGGADIVMFSLLAVCAPRGPSVVAHLGAPLELGKHCVCPGKFDRSGSPSLPSL
jgi:hypothetical protein